MERGKDRLQSEDLIPLKRENRGKLSGKIVGKQKRK